MRAAILLGLRLAVGTGGQRTRSVMMVTASAVGSMVLLLVWGIAHSQVGTTTAFPSNPGAVTLLVAGTIGMVALPVLVFVATIARLSARVRDRRLSNLRLLGLSAAQTRWVAAAEVGFASLVGVVAGAVAFLAAAPLVSRIDVPGRDWTSSSLTPPTSAWICVLAVLPAITVLTAALPQRLSSDRALPHVRHGDIRSVQLVRLVPLVLGFALCWATRGPLLDRKDTLPPGEVLAILAGIALLAIGMLLVIPVFVALVATLVLRLGRGPLATLIGRRLQTQPAGATRVIAALMIGLFIVVGARGVLVAFLATNQYINAADFVERAQTAEVTASPSEANATASVLRSLEGVQRVTSFPVLYGEPVESSAPEENMVTVLVASCTDLGGEDGQLAGCSDQAASLVGDPWIFDSDVEAMRVHEGNEYEPRGAAVVMAMDGATTIDTAEFERAVGALADTPVIVIPPDTEGVAGLLPRTDRLVVAHAGPGRFLYDRVQDAGLRINSSVDLENYDFVQGMLTLVRTLAAVIISIGLLTFTIAGIDRALTRRRELTTLRLIGTPGRLLRAAQWWEAALPTVFGSLLAIAAGGYAGATYLQLDDDKFMPLTTAFALAVVATVTSMLLAWITTVGTTARLNPEHIRAE